MKIAFLFLIIDNPNFPDIWDSYLEGNEDKYSIYIHPKYPKKHTWRPNNIIKHLKETSWGYITRAYIELFKEAYKLEDNVKFITISESCLPIKKFNILYNDIIINNLNESYIKKMIITKYDCDSRLKNHIDKVKGEMYIPDKTSFIKHYARFCLSKNHISILLKAEKEKKLEFFHTMHVGDEFFLTILYPLKDYINMAITFDDWNYTKKIVNKLNDKIKKLYELQEKKHKNEEDNIKKLQLLRNDINKNPKTIIKVSKTDLKQIKETDSYFYRKFSKESNIGKVIKKIV